MWLFLSPDGNPFEVFISPSGFGKEVCADHTPISSHGCNTQIRHFTPARLCEIPSAFHTSSSLASLVTPKPPFPRTRWGGNMEKVLTSAQAESDGWEAQSKQPWDIGVFHRYQNGLARQRGAGKTRSSWQSNCAGHCRSCNSAVWILVSLFRLAQKSKGEQSPGLAAASQEETTVISI